MNCDECEIHKTYLERIIKLQNDQIEYLKSLQGTKNFVSIKDQKEINICIFDIIDHNIEGLDTNYFIERIENNYPAKESLLDIINEIITHNDYILINKEKSNIIKYMDKNNKIIYENIDTFSIAVSHYIFSQLKPIIENNFNQTLDHNDENLKENNRVRNLMLLRDNMFAKKIFSTIFNRLN